MLSFLVVVGSLLSGCSTVVVPVDLGIWFYIPLLSAPAYYSYSTSSFLFGFLLTSVVFGKVREVVSYLTLGSFSAGHLFVLGHLLLCL